MQRDRNHDGSGPFYRAIPFSGDERNRLFMNLNGRFKDMTLSSGIDFRQDGRGFAILDFDNDGYQDMAIVSPNEPRLRLVRNRIADLANSEMSKHSLRIKLVGGRQTSKATQEWSSRDPIGATVTVSIGSSKSVFQLDCGEGLSSQNSRWIHVGMGPAETIDRVEVQWPSGKTTELVDVNKGEISIYENPELESRGDRKRDDYSK